MEVVVPVEFNFDSNCSTPYITAPSSPQRFGNFFFSAPTSPARVSSFLQQLNNFNNHSSVSSVPVSSVPKPNATSFQHSIDDDFEFNFSGHLDERPSLSADELFDGGKIRPLKPPPQEGMNPFSQKSSESDPFAVPALEEETRRRTREEKPTPSLNQKQSRGRERVSTPSTGRKGSRSLSPLRVSDIIYEEKGVSSSSSSNSKTTSYASSLLSSIPFTKGYHRKWRLKDLLLFRSASEGRATDKDPLRRKYEVLSKKGTVVEEEDVRNSSFRSTESSSGSVSKRRGPVSAHELHYTVNRAASEEMKKKTFLPYKQGLLGCLGFNPHPGTMQEISRGIGSLTRS